MLAWRNTFHKYELGVAWLDSSPTGRVLGLQAESRLNTSRQWQTQLGMHQIHHKQLVKRGCCPTVFSTGAGSSWPLCVPKFNKDVKLLECIQKGTTKWWKSWKPRPLRSSWGQGFNLVWREGGWGNLTALSSFMRRGRAEGTQCQHVWEWLKSCFQQKGYNWKQDFNLCFWLFQGRCSQALLQCAGVARSRLMQSSVQLEKPSLEVWQSWS